MAGRDGGGCYFVVMVIIVIGGAIYAACSWLGGVFTGHRAEHAALLEEARQGIVSNEAGVRTLRAHGIIKRQRLENGKWVYAGENETMATYLVGPAGEGNVQCIRDVSPMAEGPGFYRREFQALYLHGTGKVIITRQGPVDGNVSSDADAAITEQRPPLMSRGDDAAGWHNVAFGKWPGCGSDGLLFSEFLGGKRTGVKLAARDDTVNGAHTIRIRADSGSGRIDVYWLDPNNNYSITRWEKHARDAQDEHILEAWEVKEFMHTQRGTYYPDVIEGEAMGPDGTVTEKWRLDVTDIWVNEDAATMETLTIPPGKITLHQQGQPDQTLPPNPTQNALLINGGWRPATRTAPATQGP